MQRITQDTVEKAGGNHHWTQKCEGDDSRWDESQGTHEDHQDSGWLCREDRGRRPAGSSSYSFNIIGNNLIIPLKIKIACEEAMVTAASVNVEELLREFPKLQCEDIHRRVQGEASPNPHPSRPKTLPFNVDNHTPRIPRSCGGGNQGHVPNEEGERAPTLLQGRCVQERKTGADEATVGPERKLAIVRTQDGDRRFGNIHIQTVRRTRLER